MFVINFRSRSVPVMPCPFSIYVFEEKLGSHAGFPWHCHSHWPFETSRLNKSVLQYTSKDKLRSI